ncbi:hypothetical protein HaSNPVNNg1_gp068 [Helicoverpa armigera nucleopolyhedrovirus]|nr:hypothetical protein HaSNPVNNg1_gp068 [Helicoverpa armigera nucleopolyhedrovirus]
MYRNRGIPSYAAKYKNTDVNSGTVQSLLRTINSMSQRCKSLDATEDILQRIRSIIVLYRPYLIDRHDLQVPELIIEALASPRHHDQPMHSQITHNYNYKYDYNSNVPLANSVDAFGTPVRNNMAQPTQPSAPPPPPVQVINQYPVQPPNAQPATTTSAGVTPSSPPTRLTNNDVSLISGAIENVCVDFTSQNMNKFTSTLIDVVMRAFSDDSVVTPNFVAALRRLYCLDQKFIERNDINELLDCVNGRTGSTFRSMSQVCNVISQLHDNLRLIHDRLLANVKTEKLPAQMETNSSDMGLADETNLQYILTSVNDRVEALQLYKSSYNQLADAIIARDRNTAQLQNLNYSTIVDVSPTFLTNLTERLIDLMSNVDRKTLSVKNEQTALRDLREQINEQKNEIDTLRANAKIEDYEQIKTERDQLKQRLITIETNYTQLENRCKIESDNYIKTETTNETVTHQNRLLEEQYKELETEVNVMRREIERLESTTQKSVAAVDEVRLLNDQISYLKNKEADDNSIITALRQALGVQISEYKNQVAAEQQQRLTAITNDIQTATNNIESIRVQITRIENILDKNLSAEISGKMSTITTTRPSPYSRPSAAPPTIKPNVRPPLRSVSMRTVDNAEKINDVTTLAPSSIVATTTANRTVNKRSVEPADETAAVESKRACLEKGLETRSQQWMQNPLFNNIFNDPIIAQRALDDALIELQASPKTLPPKGYTRLVRAIGLRDYLTLINYKYNINRVLPIDMTAIIDSDFAQYAQNLNTLPSFETIEQEEITKKL